MPRPAPLSSFRVRPRFEQRIGLDPDTARERILRSLREKAPDLVVNEFPGFIGIHIADRDRRTWSPRLFLSLEPAAEGGTRIEGIYGPEIEIWSVFLYGYLGTGLLGTFSGIYGACQHLLGQRPWGLWVCAGMATGALLLYLGAQLGQKFGAWQTFQLHQAYSAAASDMAGPVESGLMQ